MKVTFDINSIGIFRRAVSKDIVKGNIVFIYGDENVLTKLTIEEVYNTTDDWKAFCASDGCRYGLLDLFVLKSKTDLHKEIDTLKSKIDRIKSIVDDYNSKGD